MPNVKTWGCLSNSLKNNTDVITARIATAPKTCCVLTPPAYMMKETFPILQVGKSLCLEALMVVFSEPMAYGLSSFSMMPIKEISLFHLVSATRKAFMNIWICWKEAPGKYGPWY